MAAYNTITPRASHTTLAWLSDIHLEFLHTRGAADFYREIKKAPVDGIILTGDISSSFRIGQNLTELASLGKPVYFTTGNHEYFGSSFAAVDEEIADTCSKTAGLVRLGQGEIVRLSTDTVLIGHAGWGDGRAGLGSKSTFKMDDAEAIEEFRGLSQTNLFRKLRTLGDSAARYIEHLLPLAAAHADTVYIATHVPPFTKAARHGKGNSSPEALPYFTNQALGEVLLRFALKWPSKCMVVLCGHTHTCCQYQPTANLLVKVAGVRLGSPKIQEILTA